MELPSFFELAGLSLVDQTVSGLRLFLFVSSESRSASIRAEAVPGPRCDWRRQNQVLFGSASVTQVQFACLWYSHHYIPSS